MILNDKQKESFELTARPLIKWLNDNCHIHVIAIIDCDRAELTEGIYNLKTDDYIKD